LRYDDAGNLLVVNKGDKRLRYAYNSQNQLMKSDTNGKVVSYAYDPLGRRIKKKDSRGETIYLWDGDVLLGEQRGEAKTIYVHEPHDSRPVCQIRNGQIYFYHLDHRGSALVLTDEVGALVWEARYKAYGRIAKLGIKAIDNPLRFRGWYFDPISGLLYNRYGYYKPGMGKYIHPPHDSWEYQVEAQVRRDQCIPAKHGLPLPGMSDIELQAPCMKAIPFQIKTPASYKAGAHREPDIPAPNPTAPVTD
jgi:RHS repeat-associated protein